MSAGRADRRETALQPRCWRPTPFFRASAAIHLAAPLALAAAPRRWPAVAAVLVADHALAAAAGLWPRSHLLGPNLDRLPAAGGNRVALSFDDGPDPEVTPAVLDLLDRHHARASFFLIGRRAAEHPELVARIVERGHRVENHTWSHSYAFSLFGPRRAAVEVDRAQQELTRLAGTPPVYLRPPAGLRSPWFEALLAARGLTLASWTRRGFDTVERRPQRVAGRLLRHLAPGDLLLLHDGGAARDRGGRPVVLPALAALLTELDRRGLSAVAVPPAAACRPLRRADRVTPDLPTRS